MAYSSTRPSQSSQLAHGALLGPTGRQHPRQTRHTGLHRLPDPDDSALQDASILQAAYFTFACQYASYAELQNGSYRCKVAPARVNLVRSEVGGRHEKARGLSKGRRLQDGKLA